MRTLLIPVLSALVAFSTLLGACGSDRDWPYAADPGARALLGQLENLFSPNNR